MQRRCARLRTPGKAQLPLMFPDFAAGLHASLLDCKSMLTLPAALRGGTHALEHHLGQARCRRCPLLCLLRCGGLGCCCRGCDALAASSSAADNELLPL